MTKFFLNLKLYITNFFMWFSGFSEDEEKRREKEMLIDIDLQKTKDLIKELEESTKKLEDIFNPDKIEDNIISDIKITRDLNSKIKNAPNFTYQELIRSDTATRLKINNIPDKDIYWENLESLVVNVLQPVRNEFGPIRVTSGFRSLKLNKAIGGSESSSHLVGEAADIEPYDNSIKLIDILEFIYTKLNFRELIAEYFLNGWIHVSFRNNSNIKRLKLKDKDHNYSLVSLDYLKKMYL